VGVATGLGGGRPAIYSGNNNGPAPASPSRRGFFIRISYNAGNAEKMIPARISDTTCCCIEDEEKASRKGAKSAKENNE
jgi:hypothetical protein